MTRPQMHFTSLVLPFGAFWHVPASRLPVRHTPQGERGRQETPIPVGLHLSVHLVKRQLLQDFDRNFWNLDDPEISFEFELLVRGDGSSRKYQQRDGGGIKIALDKHLENKRKAR